MLAETDQFVPIVFGHRTGGQPSQVFDPHLTFPGWYVYSGQVCLRSQMIVDNSGQLGQVELKCHAQDTACSL
jgi:hypothetical protein